MAAIRLEMRLERSKGLEYMIPVGSVLLALLVGGFILLGTGTNPIAAYSEMFREAFGTDYGLSETLVKATPLMLCGLGVMLTFKMLFWNIGAEGQLHMGAFAATWIVLTGWEGSAWAMIPTMMAVAMIAGAIWAFIPALLKIKLGLPRVRSLEGPRNANFPLTRQFPESAQLFRFGDSRVHLGIVFAVVAAIILHFLQERSRWGYEISVMGENPKAAQYAGMNTGRNIVLVMLISGGLSGLAGMAEVTGIQLRLLHGISPPSAPYGYTAIIVAWLARRNPWGVVLVSLLMGGLYVGGEALQITMRLPVNIVLIIQALILFFVLGGDILARYRIVLRRTEAAVGLR